MNNLFMYIQPMDINKSWPFLLLNIFIIISFIIIIYWLNREKKISGRRKDFWVFFILFLIMLTVDLYIFPLENFQEFLYTNVFHYIMGIYFIGMIIYYSSGMRNAIEFNRLLRI